MAGNVRSAPAPFRAVSLTSRLFGLGSVFGKTIRDSRRASLVVGLVVALIILVAAKVMTAQYATDEGRKELLNLAETMPPMLQGMAGRPVAVDTLGGFMTWKYGVFFPLITGLWSILALSSTLALETRRGSIEFVAASPVARRAIALEKLLGHVAMVAVAMVFVFLAAIAAGRMGLEARDDISVTAAFGNAVWLGLTAVMAGSVAFAIAPFLGRSAAAGIAGSVMFAGFILNGYQTALPALVPFAHLSWFDWTRDQIPLAGRYDWPSLAFTAAVAAILCAIGIEAFARRDLGATSAVPMPRLPRQLIGIGGPTVRAASDRLPTAIAWGLGIAVFGGLMASAAKTFADEFSKSSELLALFGNVFKGLDVTFASGFLQLIFVELGLVLAGLAAATLVGGWASDETSGRLEMLLATPLGRVRWVVSGALGVLAGIVALVAIAAVGLALGVASWGGDVATPVVGMASLAFFAAAVGGIGFAVGGIFRTELAAGVVAIFVIVTWFGEVLAKDLQLPDPIHQLALTAHLGQPMVGTWDVPGLIACTVLAVGGVALGAWGMSRRDVAR